MLHEDRIVEIGAGSRTLRIHQSEQLRDGFEYVSLTPRKGIE